MKILSNAIISQKNASTIHTKNMTFNAAPVIQKGVVEIIKPVGGLLVLAMLSNIKNGLSSQTTTSPLGEYPLNLSFPTEFNKRDFIEWASINQFGYEVKSDAVEFKNKDGQIIRRIVPNQNDPSKVHIDRIWIYKDGQEFAKFVKFADKSLKYYYDRSSDGTYMNSAELGTDGLWYDRNGKIMQFNPITSELQEGYQKPNNSLGTLTNPSFPIDFDIEEFNKWAKSVGLPAPVIEDGPARAAVFYDFNNRIVRKITEQEHKKGKVAFDCIPVYDANGISVGEYIKLTAISASLRYNYGRREDGSFRYSAQLGEDGLWHPFGQNWDEILPKNPVTGEPQYLKD